jgi:hypothetical protein
MGVPEVLFCTVEEKLIAVEKWPSKTFYTSYYLRVGAGIA